MKYYSLATAHRDTGWFLHPLTGDLHQTDLKNLASFQSGSLPQKILSALEYCNDPYKLLPPDFDSSYSLDQQKLDALRKMYTRIERLRKLNFWIMNKYAGMNKPLFRNSLEACYALGKLGYSALTDINGCLNRTLAVAKTSVEFKKSGVLFIGADLPQTSLHAWIIEDNYQPDPWDRNWINFLPMAAYAY
jgi:hypothetical protein